jgi:hypothetical protein
MNERKA